MSENERFGRASEIFVDRVNAVKPEQWTMDTPCTEWNVHDLVNHVVNEQLWIEPLMAGQTIAEVGDRLDGDLLGDDPAWANQSASVSSRAAFDKPGALDTVVHLSYGDETAANYCDQVALDLLIHGWDLSRAIGANEVLPPDLVSWAIEYIAPMQQMMEGSGQYGTRIAVTEDADDQTKLLAQMGRRG